MSDKSKTLAEIVAICHEAAKANDASEDGRRAAARASVLDFVALEPTLHVTDADIDAELDKVYS